MNPHFFRRPESRPLTDAEKTFCAQVHKALEQFKATASRNEAPPVLSHRVVRPKALRVFVATDLWPFGEQRSLEFYDGILVAPSSMVPAGKLVILSDRPVSL